MEHLEKKRKIAIMIAIMSAMLFASLNQTIVGTVLPRILSEIGGMEYLSWVFTIYMLTSSVTAILVGKLSDIYGRKPFIISGLLIFMIGSFLNGLSQNIFQLIIFRGIQGLGGGIIISTSFTSVADLFSPRERGRWQGLMGSVFGLASVFGPTLGGYIVDHFDWHWVFWLFLPFGLVALLLISWLFPSMPKKEKETVDYFGSIFITLTIVPLLLAFSWAGQKYEWVSFEIVGLFVFSIVALIIFVMIERKAQSPVLPLHLFKNNVFTLSNIASFILGAGMFGAIMYMPFFVQGVMGTSATLSGFVTMPMTLSMVTASAIIGQLITRRGKYKVYALFGLLIMTLGLFSMHFMDMDTTKMIAIMNMIIVGFGLGIAFPIFTLTVQNAVEHKFLGVATASAQLFRQIGGTIGVSIMGTIMSFRMKDEISSLSADINIHDVVQANPALAEKLSILKNPEILMDHDKMLKIQSSLTGQEREIFGKMVEILREALSYSLSSVFLTGAFIILSSVIITLFLREIPLRTSNNQPSELSSDK